MPSLVLQAGEKRKLQLNSPDEECFWNIIAEDADGDVYSIATANLCRNAEIQINALDLD